MRLDQVRLEVGAGLGPRTTAGDGSLVMAAEAEKNGEILVLRHEVSSPAPPGRHA
jgi:hypothetical protein